MKLVLVVEDEHGNAEVVRMLLEAAGYRVITAPNGKAALDLLEGEKPAVILSDFMMPTMTGGELGEAIRRNDGLSAIPFIFMSGTSEAVVRERFNDYDAFMRKPVDIEGLLLLIARFASEGRPRLANSEEVSASVRQLLRGLQLPSDD